MEIRFSMTSRLIVLALTCLLLLLLLTFVLGFVTGQRLKVEGVASAPAAAAAKTLASTTTGEPGASAALEGTPSAAAPAAPMASGPSR